MKTKYCVRVRQNRSKDSETMTAYIGGRGLGQRGEVRGRRDLHIQIEKAINRCLNRHSIYADRLIEVQEVVRMVSYEASVGKGGGVATRDFFTKEKIRKRQTGGFFGRSSGSSPARP